MCTFICRRSPWFFTRPGVDDSGNLQDCREGVPFLLTKDLTLSITICAHYVKQNTILVLIDAFVNVSLQSLELSFGEFSFEN